MKLGVSHTVCKTTIIIIKPISAKWDVVPVAPALHLAISNTIRLALGNNCVSTETAAISRNLPERPPLSPRLCVRVPCHTSTSKMIQLVSLVAQVSRGWVKDKLHWATRILDESVTTFQSQTCSHNSKPTTIHTYSLLSSTPSHNQNIHTKHVQTHSHASTHTAP